jgi:glycosyltransferase involved in cell wall biosynthesis
MNIRDTSASTPPDYPEPLREISVIMPLYNGVDFIQLSLPPLIAMQRRGDICEVIVVDDGSTDDGAEIAIELGVRVVSTDGRLGPGAARNQAARIAHGDILWFVDADVVVHEDAAKYLYCGFLDSSIVAVFGSYDDRPPAQGFFSQYKNLVHHYYHQRANEEARTFWSGCGAVRRDAFLAEGGFDVEQYKYPSIEDIELGHRLLMAGGRIQLARDLQCTHLKVWHFGNLVHTEIFRRAIPWSRLILTSTGIPDDLNVGIAEQVRAIIAGLLLLSIVLVSLGLAGASLLVPIALLTTIANKDILAFFYSRRGLWFAIAGLLFHQAYYLYSSSAFAFVVVEQAWIRTRGRLSKKYAGVDQ